MQLSAADALRVLRQRWALLLVAALLAAGAAYLYTRSPWGEPRWRSSVLVQATGRFDYGNALALQRQLRPLAEHVRQLSLMREVDRNLHLDMPAELMLGLIKAEPVDDSNQVRIDVEDADAARAEAIALEVAQVYSQQHNANEQGKVREEQVILTVLDRSSAATLTWPQTRVLVPGAALLGLIAAAVLVLVAAYLDDTLRSVEDTERALSLPVLGVAPLPRAGGRVGGRLERASFFPNRVQPSVASRAAAPRHR